MAKTLKDLEQRLEFLKTELLKEGPRIAQEMGVNHITLSSFRIQNKGVPGRQYSTKEMLATESMFNRKKGFKPTEIGSELGRGPDGKLVKGGVRNAKGEIAKKKGAKKRWLWIKFKKAKKAVPVMILPGGYKQLRQLNGLQTNFVDLTFSGRMFQNIKLLEPRNQGTKFTAVIGATNQENKQKLFGLSKRFGGFLDPTADEIEALTEIQANRIRDIFKRVLG